MFKSVVGAWSIIVTIHKLFFKHPVLTLPIMGCWLIYASSTIYLRFKMDWTPYSSNEKILIAFLIIFFFSLIISLTNIIVLELIQQIESGKSTSLINAISETFSKNLLSALPIILIWAIIWFLIIVVQSLTKKKSQDNDKNNEMTAKNIAIELANVQDFNLSTVFFESLKSGTRMLVFLMFPAIAWEDETTTNAIKRGLSVAKNHWAELGSGFLITSAMSQLIFFPAALVVTWGKKHEIPEEVWTYLLIYIGLAWTYSIYLEVLFTAELYLWDLNWRKVCKVAEAEGRPKPTLHEIKRPSLLDDNADLKHIKVKKWDA